MTTLSLYRNQQHQFFVIANFGNYGRTFAVNADNQVSDISYTPSNLVRLSTQPFHDTLFTYRALFFAKQTILMQEESIRRIGERFNLELPQDSLVLTKAFTTWVHDNQKNVTKLDLSGLGLVTIPSQIRYFTKLTSLDICNNQFRGLPSELAYLQTITHLDISDNPLEFLPNLSQLASLKELKANHIRLTEAPDWLQIMDLERIELKNNLFTSLPDWWYEWAEKKEVEVDAWNLL